MDDRLDEIVEKYICGNDPVPEEHEIFVGDGGFRGIGGEFLRHFVRIGGLKPDENVLEIGCGQGRMALPLRSYLSEQGRYLGMDVVRAGIDWCTTEIARIDKRFEFVFSDLYHPLYNSNGRQLAAEFTFPSPDNSVDFLFLVSVFTHLGLSDYKRYLSESARVLSDSGRLFATFFLIDDQSVATLAEGKSRYSFDVSGRGPIYRVEGERLLESVAVSSDWLVETAHESGLVLNGPIERGFWAEDDPRSGTSYQDIVVLGRRKC